LSFEHPTGLFVDHPTDSLRMFANTASAILGAIILISIVLPWFLIGVFFIFILYVYAAAFYRASARELKRLGSYTSYQNDRSTN
jgi:hypothetical protein